MEKFDAIGFAKYSAVMAFDQQREWGGLQESIENYFDNLRDTLIDNRVTDQWDIAHAEQAFWDKASELGYTRPEYK